MQAPDLHGLRQAALTLHALTASDLEKVWKRLDKGKREVLSPLLDELDQLGVPRGRPWLAGAAEMASDTASTSASKDTSTCRQVVWSLAPQDALSLLVTQSVDTAAVVIQLAEWPWRRAVSEQWPPEKKHILKLRLEQRRAVSIRMSEQLIQHMAACAVEVAQSASVQSGPESLPPRRRWYDGLKSFFLFV